MWLDSSATKLDCYNDNAIVVGPQLPLSWFDDSDGGDTDNNMVVAYDDDKFGSGGQSKAEGAQKNAELLLLSWAAVASILFGCGACSSLSNYALLVLA